VDGAITRPHSLDHGRADGQPGLQKPLHQYLWSNTGEFTGLDFATGAWWTQVGGHEGIGLLLKMFLKSVLSATRPVMPRRQSLSDRTQALTVASPYKFVTFEVCSTQITAVYREQMTREPATFLEFPALSCSAELIFFLAIQHHSFGQLLSGQNKKANTTVTSIGPAIFPQGQG